MKTIIDFTFYCVYTFVPDKATLGKEHGAATLHSSMSSFFYLSVWMWINEFLVPIDSNVLVEIILIFGGHFIFNWFYFLREEKQKELANKYGHIKKWKRKLIGISFLLFCFFFFIFSSITMSILKQQL